MKDSDFNDNGNPQKGPKHGSGVNYMFLKITLALAILAQRLEHQLSRFNSSQGHVRELHAPLSVVGMQEAANQWFAHIIDVSHSLPLWNQRRYVCLFSKSLWLFGKWLVARQEWFRETGLKVQGTENRWWGVRLWQLRWRWRDEWIQDTIRGRTNGFAAGMMWGMERGSNQKWSLVSGLSFGLMVMPLNNVGKRKTKQNRFRQRGS